MFTIKKIINGNMRELHKGINSFESAREILRGIAAGTRGRKYLTDWTLEIPKQGVTYRITN